MCVPSSSVMLRVGDGDVTEKGPSFSSTWCVPIGMNRACLPLTYSRSKVSPSTSIVSIGT